MVEIRAQYYVKKEDGLGSLVCFVRIIAILKIIRGESAEYVSI